MPVFAGLFYASPLVIIIVAFVFFYMLEGKRDPK